MPRDTNAAAHLVVAMATGEAPAESDTGKNPAAVALGRLGGLKGGRARAKGMTRKARSEAAKRAAKARWGKSS
jgi:hypothetical protein